MSSGFETDLFGDEESITATLEAPVAAEPPTEHDDLDLPGMCVNGSELADPPPAGPADELLAVFEFEVDLAEVLPEQTTNEPSGETATTPAESTEATASVVAEPVAVAPLTSETPTEPTSEDDNEADWKSAINKARDYFTDIAIAYAKSRDQTKRLKKETDLALEKLQAVIDHGPSGESGDDDDDDDDHDDDVEAAVPTQPTATAEPKRQYTREEWRIVPIEHLNLKPKITERLKESGIDTIGNLEDRRALIYQGKEKWPKGIGEAKITEIENAVIDWLTKNRDTDKIETSDVISADDGPADEAVTETAAEAVEAIAVEPSETSEASAETQADPIVTADIDPDAVESGNCPAEVEAAQSSTVDELPPETVQDKPKRKRKPKKTDADVSEATTDPDKQAILARAAEINNGQNESLDSYHPEGDKYWQSGYEAWQRHTPLDECPLSPGPHQDDWIRGWLAHDIIDRYENGRADK